MSDAGNPDTEFNPRYKGGVWASRIETQDKVAAIVAVEALGGTLELVSPNLLSEGGRIAFEARDDFELRWQGGRQYVSVKDRQVDRSELFKGIESLRKYTEIVRMTTPQTMRLEVAGLTSNARSFYEDVARLRLLKSSAAAEDYERACADFSQEHGLSATWAERLVVVERRIGDNPSLANAIFSHAMRNALPVHNYSDSSLVALFNDITRGVLRDKRLRRGVLDLSDLERMLLAPMVSPLIASYMVEYVKTEFGYIRERKRAVEIEKEELLVKGFKRKLMKEWRRKTFWRRFKNSGLVRQAVSCISCGHPLIANLNGRHGLACPKCGYNPYLTLFYACDCGSGAVLIRQPNLSSFLVVRDLYRILRVSEVRCMGCSNPPSLEKLLPRIFMLPIPYPVEEYTDEQLIEWRVKLGWRNNYEFKSPMDPKLSPEEALWRTVDSEALKDFPYDGATSSQDDESR